ncbi:MAG: hydrogenase formation protein HypD [Methanocalculus sp. MSAO_Arc1]|uniref:hydrogenase formation protein HypD n=1 Tax=Methanocalculus TaxID=71151 RepID=UPI000FF5257A|nr:MULTISPECIES: hydrogenase formation protein HypD [unclassified Methanocalculus]MCP1661796.1 hydrogenase expression/formation protein HypD [Methanocalculus sp. AMF5]RQD80188.1 MAG: hydrogenase formation protein HypD [Methanocalculus sp. MSAO_Arc1]
MAVGRDIIAGIREQVRSDLRIMHVCGTHEAAIAKHGIRSVLPDKLKVVMGPGCPVCITPAGEIDTAISLAESGKIVTTYGDLLRVPGSEGSLESADGDIRIVQGIHKAVEIAKTTDRDVVFISVGFETTVPTVAATLLQEPPDNFSILSCHRVVPPAMQWLLDQGEANLNGFILPGHVCTVMGYHEYEHFPVPQVVAGFEAEDLLLGLFMLIQQINDGRAEVENAYPRAVTREGNTKAQALMYEVFEPCDIEWRGFPVIPGSGMALKRQFEAYDAEKKYGITIPHIEKRSPCICDQLLRGLADPTDCPLFGTACTPRTPVGPCMVSHEGACKIWQQFR